MIWLLCSNKRESDFSLLLNYIFKRFFFCIWTPGLSPGFLAVTQFSTPRRIYTGGLECVDCNPNQGAFGLITNVLTVEKRRLSFGLRALCAFTQLPCKEAQDLPLSCTLQQLPAPGPGETHGSNSFIAQAWPDLLIPNRGSENECMCAHIVSKFILMTVRQKVINCWEVKKKMLLSHKCILLMYIMKNTLDEKYFLRIYWV